MTFDNTGLQQANFEVMAILPGQVVDVQAGRVLVIGVQVLVVDGYLRLDGAVRIG